MTNGTIDKVEYGIGSQVTTYVLFKNKVKGNTINKIEVKPLLGNGCYIKLFTTDMQTPAKEIITNQVAITFV